MDHIREDKIYLDGEDNQKIMFYNLNDDYYLTLYSDREARSGDYYSFTVNNDNSIYNPIKTFIEKEIDCSKDESVKKTPYFLINNSSVKIADQDQTIIDADWVKFEMLPDKIKIEFSDKFPVSIKIGNHQSFLIPIVELFDQLKISLKENVNSYQKVIK